MFKKNHTFLSRMIQRRQEAQQRKRKKAEIVTEIISRRNFDVPENFIIHYMTDDVMDCITDNFPTNGCIINKYSSIAMMKTELGEVVINNYRNFISNIRAQMNSNLATLKMNFARNSFLQKLHTPMAILTLETEKEWKKFIKMKEAEATSKESFLLYVSVLIAYMADLHYNIPKVIINIVFNYKYAEVLAHSIKCNNFGYISSDYLIRQADAYDMLSYNLDVIWAYWSIGGTYFPESSGFIENIALDCFDPDNCEQCTEYIMNYLQNVETEHVAKTYGYYLFEYVHMLMSNIGVEMHDVLFGSGHIAIWSIGSFNRVDDMLEVQEPTVVCTIFDDIMKDDAYRDINSLGYLFKLPLHYPDESYMALRKKFGIDLEPGDEPQDQSLKKEIERLMIASEVPLKDMMLYRLLFRKYIPSAEFVREFIIHRGNPTTIRDADFPDHINICYKISGIELMLNYTENDEDILLMFEDEKFVNELFRTVSGDAADILHINCIDRLLKILMYINDSSGQFCKLIDHLISQLPWGRIPLECVEYFTTKPNVRTDVVAIHQMIKVLGPDCVGYIPAHLLPKSILEQRARSPRSKFLKLNTKNLYLDEFMSLHDLDNIIVTNNNIQYIPDLSFVCGYDYIDRAISEE